MSGYTRRLSSLPLILCPLASDNLASGDLASPIKSGISHKQAACSSFETAKVAFFLQYDATAPQIWKKKT
jgi:hypothetical protein